MTEPLTSWDRALATRLRAVSTAALSTALRKRGYSDAVIQGVYPLVPGSRLVGRARTLRLVPFRLDLFEERGGGYNAQKRLYDELESGDVLVVGARATTTTGTLGDVLALRAQVRGAAGVVTDGAVRDSAALTAVGLPVFAAGRNPVVVSQRHVPWETDVVIDCGGAAVVPGDVLVGDDDGVLVIPAGLAGEVLEDAERQEQEDAWVAARVAEGNPVRGLFPMDAAWRERYTADLSAEEGSA